MTSPREGSSAGMSITVEAGAMGSSRGGSGGGVTPRSLSVMRHSGGLPTKKNQQQLNNNNHNPSGQRWVSKNTHVLEGDGVVPHLFNYLYRMDRSMRGRQHALVGPPPPTTTTVSTNTNGSSGNGDPLDATQGSSALNVTSSSGMELLGTTQSSAAVYAGATPANGDPTLGASGFTPHSLTGFTASAQALLPTATNHTSGLTKKGGTFGGRSRLGDWSGGAPRYALPIPDTVIYDHNFPQAWFSYSKSPPEMVKRPGKFLDAQHIYRRMCKVEPGCGGICAQFSCSVPHPTDLNQPPELKVLYLNPAMLEDLLYSRGTSINLVKHGLLQKFVPPRGTCNDMIEVVWSPKVTVCRRRVNINSLASRSVSLVNKGVTFDGLPYLSLESPANDRVSSELLDMVTTVAENLLKHEHKRVNRLVALFKQDKNCALWLIHATSVRVEGFEQRSSLALNTASVNRLPLNLNPVYQKEETEVPNEYLAEQIKRKVVLSWVGPVKPKGRGGAPRYHFTASALTRDGTTATGGGFHRRRSAQSIEQRHMAAMELCPRGMSAANAGGLATSIPPEIKMLENFFEDTFYALYASRMTIGAKSRPAIITVPLQVEHFLGKKQLDILLVSIMQLRREKSLEEQRVLDLEQIRADEVEAVNNRLREEAEEESEYEECDEDGNQGPPDGDLGDLRMMRSLHTAEDRDHANNPDDDDDDEKALGFQPILRKEDTLSPGEEERSESRSKINIIIPPSPSTTTTTLHSRTEEEEEELTGEGAAATPPNSSSNKGKVKRQSSVSFGTASSRTPHPPVSSGCSPPATAGGRNPAVLKIIPVEVVGGGAPTTTTGRSRSPNNTPTKQEAEAKTLGGPSKSFTLKKRKGPRIYVSAGGMGAQHHQQHLVPLCTVKEQCDMFLADVRAKIM